ncbi:HEAT repeat domain-containing protein [Clostridium sp. YIM B02505]|uniref:HEAT repeat domain-containing protein n=1 Tax=Clostridium yunnanense TaxID=2800325 RepID=A0ABS1ESI9_9CLOT|nr:HEAT repeat domain-containing protein [Clostridium yunnanense]MBK1812370.1 HEAT repeat domain-containing protein [Clostridium yunnanense]
MEQYIYYSIILFSTIVAFLYVYIIVEKSIEKIARKQRAKYEKQLIPEIDSIINKVIDTENTNDINIDEKRLKKILRSNIRRSIVEERISYYLENFTGEFREILIQFCEDHKIVDNELKELNTRNIYKKALCCKRLGELRSKKATKDLLEQIPTSIQDIKYNALLALAKIGDEQSFIDAFSRINGSILLSERSLIEIIDSFEGNKSFVYSKMIDAEDEFIGSLFIKSAGNSVEYALIKPIARYLDSSSKERRIAAIKALGNMKDIGYINKISNLLDDESWEIRALAAKTLGRYSDTDSIPKLIDKLSDRQWFVRYNSAVSILKLDKGLKYVYKVFEGQDKFAKDIIISAMEDMDLLARIFDDENHKYYDEKLAVLIKDYIDNGGETKDE